MKTFSTIKLCIGIIILCIVVSCKKLVTVPAPTNSLVTTSVFSNDGTAITAQFAVYWRLQNNFTAPEILNTGLSSDEFTNYSGSLFYIDLYKNNLAAQNDGGANGSWSVLYNVIYQENAIIENSQSSSGMSQRVKKLMTGEAQFIRAWSYFQLINQFGDVPLVLTTDYTKTQTLARAKVSDIYAQIVSDLQTAQTLLSADYLDVNDNPGSPDRVRPTTWAANALLARVYLYMGKYDLAEQQASLVINNNALFSLINDLTKVFKKNSAEAIWQLTPPTGQLYTSEGAQFTLTTPPVSSASGAALSTQLLNAFEVNDARRTQWVATYSSGGTTWAYPFKYQDSKQSTNLTEYSMVLRLAEQYLIRSEARAHQGKLTGSGSAAEDLNIIRQRAGLLPTTASTLTGILSAIAHERQVELFAENDRWYDLKRTKTVDAVMSVVTPQKGGVWNSYQQLYPLNPSDLQYDPNLVQNPGY